MARFSKLQFAKLSVCDWAILNFMSDTLDII